MMISLPTRKGYMVSWYNGKTIEQKSRRTGEVYKVTRCTSSWITPSKEAAEKKAQELKKQGIELEGVHECFY